MYCVLLWAKIFTESTISLNHASSNSKDFQNEVGKLNFVPSLSIGVLQEIGRRCCSKVFMVSPLK